MNREFPVTARSLDQVGFHTLPVTIPDSYHFSRVTPFVAIPKSYHRFLISMPDESQSQSLFVRLWVPGYQMLTNRYIARKWMYSNIIYNSSDWRVFLKKAQSRNLQNKPRIRIKFSSYFAFQY